MEKLNIKKDEWLIRMMEDMKLPISAQIKALNSFLTINNEKISQEEKDIIELTLNSCKYTENLAEAYISVFKLNSENIKLNYENFDFSILIENSIKEFEILLKYYELKIVFEKKQKFIITADKMQIKKAVHNLLLVALRNSMKNSIINIQIFQNKKQISFEIRYISPYGHIPDTKEDGCYSRKISQKLFLHLAKEIIKAHYGLMTCKNLPDERDILGFQIPIN